MRWRVPSTTPTLHSQRAKPSPSWSRLFPETRIGRGLARIAQILWGKAPWGAGIACPPPRTPRRGATRGGGSGGSDPLFFAAGAAPGRGRWCTPKSTTSPPLFGGRSLHSDPWREGKRALARLGRINRSVRPSTPAGQVAGPVIHEPAPTLEQVRAAVGRLDLAADLVRQGSLQDLQARRHRGTRCSRFPFVRGTGMLHTPLSLPLLAPSRPRSWEREKGAAGVMEGLGESSPRSGVRRGRSPSPAPMYYIG